MGEAPVQSSRLSSVVTQGVQMTYALAQFGDKGEQLNLLVRIAAEVPEYRALLDLPFCPIRRT